MKIVYVALVFLLFVVTEIVSERSGVCKRCQHEEYTRVKRARYYPNIPLRFYNRQPTSYPIKGAFSFSQPPGYLLDDARQIQNLRSKIISRPANEGLLDDDHDIIRFPSKLDLDRAVEFANERDKELHKYNLYLDSVHETLNHITNKEEKYNSKAVYNDNILDVDFDNKFSRYGPSISFHESLRPYNIGYNNHDISDLRESKPFRIPELEPSALFINKNKIELNTQHDTEKNMQRQHLSNVNAYVRQEGNGNGNSANYFSDSSIMQEEQLPKPSNLREEDFEVSHTNNVPTIVKADSNSYKIESLGTLPLMNYHSKLETVDSYRVPHYTVTSPEKFQGAPSNTKIPVEPAPPASTAQEQSDAHLKVTKIWTHKSRGTAYTLHDDGTLSLEKPSRRKIN